MNRKPKIFTPKSMAIGTLAVAATAFSSVIMSPSSAQAQNSPVSPTTTVDPVDFGFNLGGTETTSEETTTTETTTTTTTEGETTTTTTTTTTETSSTTETTSSQETTESTTEVATDTSTTDSTNILETTNVSTGVEAQSGVTSEQTTTSTQETVAIVLSLSEEYANATGIEFLFISDLASELGVAGDFLVGTLVFENVRGLRGNRQAALVAFRNALRKAGVFTIDAFDNQAFAEFFTSYATAEEVAAAFNGLSEVRILFLSRSSVFANNFRFRLFRVKGITLVQFVVYKETGIRALTFPRARSGNNNGIDDADED